MLSWHASNQSSPVQNTLVELGSKFLWCTERGLASLTLTHLQYSPGNRPPRCLFLGVVTVAERVWKRTASQLALYTSQGTLCFQPPALTLALLMSIHLMLVWLPVHLFCSHSAVHCTNCWEQWKSRLCFLNKLLLSRYLLTCLSFDPFLLHVPPPFTAPLSFWSRVTACLPLPSLSQACPTSSPSEMSETGLLHSDCSSPSSLADTTAPQPSTDKVINTHPQWILEALHTQHAFLILNSKPGCVCHRFSVMQR